jgi:hypothetical protein
MRKGQSCERQFFDRPDSYIKQNVRNLLLDSIPLLKFEFGAVGAGEIKSQPAILHSILNLLCVKREREAVTTFDNSGLDLASILLN